VLSSNFAPHSDCVADIQKAKGYMQIIVGANDEFFDATRFSDLVVAEIQSYFL
jgi:hypothetical protein